MKIVDVSNKVLKISPWGATSILRPEKMLLRVSLLEHGWLQPLVVRSSDNTIIDGYQRYLISVDEDKFVKKHGSSIPVLYQDVDEIDAMVLHVRLNRAKGSVNSYALSRLIKRIISSNKYY